MLSLSIQPLIVFDGPHKPPFKRGRHTSRHGPSLLDFQAKELLNYLGIPYHTAPGEAEAECALLQREGVVDAVLSEDVDVLMFGCTLSLRNWSAEGPRGSKDATHVSVYDAETVKRGKSGLTRWGMVLVALMSGGDYNPAGITGCGVKLACEAAKAGFGDSLCKIPDSDSTGLMAWRENLLHELRTNEGGHFRVKHSKLQLTDDFPKKDLLRYYTNPVISPSQKVEELRAKVQSPSETKISGLRVFVAKHFDWCNRAGATKYIRGLAPVILVRQLRAATIRYGNGENAPGLQASEIIQSVCGHRRSFSTDGFSELQVSYIPLTIVGLDLDAEEPDNIEADDGTTPPDKEATPTEGPSDEDREDAPPNTTEAPPRKRASPRYDPTQPQKTWLCENLVKKAAPLEAQQWEEQRSRKKTTTHKAASRKVRRSGGMREGAIEPYVRITKPGVSHARSIAAKALVEVNLRSPIQACSSGLSSQETNPSNSEINPAVRPGSLFPKGEPSKSCHLEISDDENELPSLAEALCKETRESGFGRVSSSMHQDAPSARSNGRPLRHDRTTNDTESTRRRAPPLDTTSSNQLSVPSQSITRPSGSSQASIIITSSPPTSLPPSPSANEQSNRLSTTKRLVCLRESLEGAWKEVNGVSSKVGTKRRVWESVEVVDLG